MLKNQMLFSRKMILERIEYPLFGLAFLCIIFGLWNIYIQQKASRSQPVFPKQVYIDNVLVSGQTRAQATTLLENSSAHGQSQYFLSSPNIVVASSSAELGIHKNYQAIVDKAWNENTRPITWFSAFLSPTPQSKKYEARWEFDPVALEKMILVVKVHTDQAGQIPQATLSRSGSLSSLKVDPGKTGQEVNTQATLTELSKSIQQQQASTSAILTSPITPLTPEQTTQAIERSQKYVGKEVVFQKEGLDQFISDQKMISFLNFPEGFSESKINDLLTQWQKSVNTEPQDAVLEYDPQTLKVKTFKPPRNGITLNLDETRTQIIQAFSAIETNTDVTHKVYAFPLSMQEAPSKKTLADTNNIGIKERVAFGESEYEHSIPGRIHNVSLTAERINNTIVPAGEEFSFNKTLGEVSAETGFAPAYVIRGGRTELGDGGGVCQVSTTLFRALLNGGIPVTKRIAHSYRVSYYELNAKPGIDATVYAGNVDLRFKNDTGHALLIHTETFPKSLYMFVEIYGTSDGRTAEIINHKTWDFVPAPPPLYQEDPTLPRGTTKQVDFSAAGIKASFTNVVKDKNGKIIREDTYNSNYKPWQAVYLVGTG